MQFHAKRLPDGRWGIYAELNLLASIGCPQTCQDILAALQARQPQRRQPPLGIKAISLYTKLGVREDVLHFDIAVMLSDDKS